jgi:hypothetical protein
MGREQNLGPRGLVEEFRPPGPNTADLPIADETIEPLLMELDNGDNNPPGDSIDQTGRSASGPQTAESDNDSQWDMLDDDATSPNQIVSPRLVEDSRQKPVVYSAGNLPKELPSWFEQLDANRDGQVGLYEWKASGWSLEDFQRLDCNDDGFLTIEEVLRWTIQAGNDLGEDPVARTSHDGPHRPE